MIRYIYPPVADFQSDTMTTSIDNYTKNVHTGELPYENVDCVHLHIPVRTCSIYYVLYTYSIRSYLGGQNNEQTTEYVNKVEEEV